MGTTGRQYEEQIASWFTGWTVSRGLRSPVRVAGGFRVDDVRPDRKARYVLPRLDAAALRGIPADPATWVTVFTDPAALAPLLPAPWVTRDDADHLMETELVHEPPAPPAGYSIALSTAGPVTTVRVLDQSGAEAAHGQYARTGRYAIVDKVETDPAHRRRGLGTTVMRVLTSHAVLSGRTTGLLAATNEGRALYTTLGWRWVAPMAVALIPATT